MAPVPFWHLPIGIGEAAITLVVISFIWRTRPDLIYTSARKNRLTNSPPLVHR
ncbi:MAG: hypothetical protein HC936_19000 [Leptolyngbyaceae cyanobacterium SU_3_3]|nr:hypothetical protein [Leptolyngbyaceae cyanobacterium SU_3_3]